MPISGTAKASQQSVLYDHLALHYFYYNFIRKHQTLKTTPAVAAGIADKALTIMGLVQMVEDQESKLGERLTSYVPAKKKGP